MGYKLISNPMRWLKGQMMKRMHGMITCREFEDFIMSYLSDELTPTQSRVFKMHLRMCRECREYLAAYQRSIEMSGLMFKDPDDKLPEDVPEDLIKAILSARSQQN